MTPVKFIFRLSFWKCAAKHKETKHKFKHLKYHLLPKSFCFLNHSVVYALYGEVWDYWKATCVLEMCGWATISSSHYPFAATINVFFLIFFLYYFYYFFNPNLIQILFPPMSPTRSGSSLVYVCVQLWAQLPQPTLQQVAHSYNFKITFIASSTYGLQIFTVHSISHSGIDRDTYPEVPHCR